MTEGERRLYTRYIANAWLLCERYQPWLADPLPHIQVNYALFKDSLWLPVEVAIENPKLCDLIKTGELT